MSGTGAWPTIVDVAGSTDSNGKSLSIAWLLSQSNYIYDDMPMKAANEKRRHAFSFQTSMPAGYWVGYNQGTPYSKMTKARAAIGLGRLRDYSQIDRSLIDDEDDGENYRITTDSAFLMGMGQTITGTLIYGNTNINPTEFMGLTGFYNTLNPAAANSANVIPFGGTGTSNTSLWLIDWGQYVFGVYPRNSKAGLVVENYGTTRDGRDQFGNRFPAYTVMFEQAVGFVPTDWRRIVRGCNIDVTSAGLAGPNAPDLFVLMDQMLQNLPSTPNGITGNNKTDAPNDPMGGSRCVFYCDRTVRHFLNTQAMRNRNVLLALTDYDGKSCETYRGIPIKTVDQILNTESTVTTASGPT
jgi:hypothetical protein